MHLKAFIFFITLTCLLVLGVYAMGRSGIAEAEGVLQTWPSRTPTPGSQPTQPSGGSTPGGGSSATETVEATPQDSVTSTPQVTEATSTPTVVSTGFPTVSVSEVSSNGEASTANNSVDCGLPPTLKSLARIAVREQPGLDAPNIGILEAQDPRIIVGRSGTAPWWFIQYEPASQGWVMDNEVEVLGYTGYIPIFSSNDESSSIENLWNPTPHPLCTPAPLIGPADTINNPTKESDSSRDVDTVKGQIAVTPTSGTMLVTEATPSPQMTAETGLNDTSQASDANYTWLLVTGIFLIVVGAVSLLLRRWTQ